MKDLDEYYADHFPFRDEWIKLNTGYNRMLLKQDINGVYLSKDNYLLEKFDDIDQNMKYKQIDALNNFANAHKDIASDIYFCIVPNSIYILSEKLPFYAPNTDQKEYIDSFYSSIFSPKIKLIDVTENLLNHKDEYIYYRTDHHWTSLGAYYGYEVLSKEMEIETTPLSDFKETVVSSEFLGTLYSKGLFPVPADSISSFTINDPSFSVFLENSVSGNFDSLYDFSKLETKDKYSFFIGGNADVCKITTSSSSDKKLFLIKDSYSHCLVQFFINDYSEIYLFDLRYLKSKTISSYIEKYHPDDILIIYNAATLSTDADFHRLDMGLPKTTETIID